MQKDSLLLLGCQDPRLPKFLGKLGYTVETPDKETIPNLVGNRVFDLVLIESSTEWSGVELSRFLRDQKTTKDTPIVIVNAKRTEELMIQDEKLELIRCLPAPYTIGRLASYLATEVRLRKMAGAEHDMNASLAEANAALRDLNARFERELDDARKIQESLLPQRLPTSTAFSCAMTYLPLEEVGGDWYDIMTREDGTVVALVADVTGHGLAAAFIGSMAKLAIAAAGAVSPGAMLGRMNELLTPQMPEGRFITMAVAQYSPASGQVTFARAGHPPALHFRAAQGDVVEVKGQGVPLGFLEIAAYPEESTALQAGDALVIYSDGLTEAQDRNRKMYGEGRLKESLLKNGALATAEEIRAGLRQDFEHFRDGRLLRDDVSVLVLKRSAS